MNPDLDVRELARIVESRPTIASLSAGPAGVVATYLVGSRIPGVRVSPSAVELHVVARWGYPMAEVVADVRDAVRPLVGRNVDVVVEDVEDPPMSVTTSDASWTHRAAAADIADEPVPIPS